MGDGDSNDDDGDDFRPPPAPDDRLWRHPAEVGARAVARPRRRLRRNPWALGLASAVSSTVIAGSLMIGAGGLGEGPERIALQPLATLVPNNSDRAPSGIVSIEVDSEPNGRAGNGLILADGVHVVTSLQLVSSPASSATPPTVRVIDDSGEVYDGVVVTTDARNDLAIVRTSTTRLRPRAQTPDAILDPGVTVTALGGGRSAGLRAWTNQVLGVAESHGEQLVGLATLAEPLPVTAVGAVVVNDHGHFAGLLVIDLTAAASDASAAILPAKRVHATVAQFLASGRIDQGWLGIESASPDETDRSVSLPAGATVDLVVAESPAHQAGVRVGDVVTRVCERPIASIEDIVALMSLTTPGTRCAIEVERSGERWQTNAVVGRRAA